MEPALDQIMTLSGPVNKSNNLLNKKSDLSQSMSRIGSHPGIKRISALSASSNIADIDSPEAMINWKRTEEIFPNRSPHFSNEKLSVASGTTSTLRQSLMGSRDPISGGRSHHHVRITIQFCMVKARYRNFLAILILSRILDLLIK